MITLQALALVAALAGPTQIELLDFYSDQCVPCRSMDPTIRRLMADGYPVRKVNVQNERQLTRKYQVDCVPTFVLVADGQEVNRAVGPVSYDQLRQMIVAAKPQVQQIAAPSPPTAAAPSSPPAAPAPFNPQARALHATVRLRVEDNTGHSYGTGTIIDAHGDEALVMTCGHIFRESGGRGSISVDLFAPGAKGPVPGQLIACDLKQDTALVAIRPGLAIAPVPVGQLGCPIQRGDRVFSIGCDRGENPTIWDSQVTAVNKYQGPANIVASGQPVIGRSGGGLFSAAGQLIGVCNLADPTDGEGIYAALSVLQQTLDRTGLARVYQNSAPQIAAAPNPPPAPLTGDDVEVTVTFRSKQDPAGPGRSYVLERPSRELLNLLAVESRAARNSDPAIVAAGEAEASVASRPPRTVPSDRSPILRGQSSP